VMTGQFERFGGGGLAALDVDDYLPKPFRVAELRGRVKSLLASGAGPAAS
jgi:DNA-binding response OmpR family regulator